MISRWSRGLITSVAAVLVLNACSDGAGPGDRTSLSLSVAAGPTAVAQRSGPASVVTQSDGTSTLELTRVALVLREIELSSDEVESCDHSGVEGDDDHCEELEVGPVLLELPLDGGVSHVVTIDVPAGTYDELEFEVHKPGDDSADLAFLQAHPGFDGVSILVEGSFDGVAFVFTQDLSEEQEVSLDDPLLVQDGVPANVTLRIDVSGWFVAGDGTLIDPATAGHGGTNEALVETNIRRSIDAFEDHDEDGEHDD
jgi:hypothetical protein